MRYLLLLLVFASCSAKQPVPKAEIETVQTSPYMGCDIFCETKRGFERLFIPGDKYPEKMCLRNDVLECVQRAVYKEDRFHSIEKEIPALPDSQTL